MRKLVKYRHLERDTSKDRNQNNEICWTPLFVIFSIYIVKSRNINQTTTYIFSRRNCELSTKLRQYVHKTCGDDCNTCTILKMGD